MHNNMLDSLHRGYLAYLNETQDSSDCGKLQRLILRADKRGENCDTTMSTCEVKTDWIERIEEAMPFIERAVRENRQFILRQGETVPIEKVRRVSKTSVEHLARHSEMITREPKQGESVVPDKLLMTENVSTYAVYENRFLYMLLCYVKDFTEIKHARISALSSTFSSEISFDKDVSSKDKKISFSLKYSEMSSSTAPSEVETETAKSLLRMKNIIVCVDALLKTGLMVEVSAAPMLKPPIARTNVLLQNPCFVAAMELYDYLCAYTGDGYEKKEMYRQNGGMSEEARSDYANLVAITSYLAYRHGGLSDELDRRYSEDEEKRKEQERRLRDERIRALKKTLPCADDKTAEYIMALEDKCRDADGILQELIEGKALVKEAEEKLAQAEEIQEAARAELGKMKQELMHKEELRQLSEEQHRSELANAKFIMERKDEEFRKAAENHKAEVEKLTEEFKAEYSSLAEELRLQTARLRSIKLKENEENGEEDFSSKEAFTELEAEYRAFKAFFEAQWKKTKKQIRLDNLWKK